MLLPYHDVRNATSEIQGDLDINKQKIKIIINQEGQY